MINFSTKGSLFSYLILLLFSVQSQANKLSEDDSIIEARSSLLSHAESKGELPVIIKLKVETQPEGQLETPAIADQQHSIYATQASLLNKLSRYKPKQVKHFDHLPLTAMKLSAEGIRAAMLDPEVIAIYEDKLSRPTLADSTPLIGATTAAASGFSGQGQTIAILDTGVDKSHPFLAGKIVHEACFSQTISSQGSTTVCPNGQNSQTGSGAGVPCSSSINGCNHGTHVAGIAAGKGSAFSGTARDANIMAIQVFSQFTGTTNCGSSSPCALSYTSDQILALEHVYSQRNNFNIAAVNMSLGGGQFFSACDADPRKAAIDLLRSVGIATISSSGNEGFTNSMGAPACISSAISVGSTTKADSVSAFSNSASFLDFLAPGSSINSSIPGGIFAFFSGTSMAAPHVAGAFAILRSRLPSASVDQIVNSLKNSGTGVTDTRNGITKPRIRVDSALSVLTPPAIPTLFVSPAESFSIIGPQGGSFSPGSRTFTLSNLTSSGQSLSYTISENASWLQISSGSSGSIQAGSSKTVTLSVNTSVANNLSTGTYAAQITFTNTTNNAGNLTIPVSLIVSGNNDFFINAIPLGTSGEHSGTIQDNNTGASKETGEPDHAKGNGNKSVWWKWTAPANGDITIETCGSSFDTVLGIYTGTVVNALGEIVNNDDACDLQSRVTFSARSGITYHIAVDGFSGDSGDITLSWNFTSDSTPSPNISILPAADITFTGPSSGPFNPASTNYSVTNVGSQDQVINVEAPSWLTASTQTFTLTPGSTQAISFTINSISASLPAGIYSGIIDFGFTARAIILNLTSGALTNDDFQSAITISDNVASIEWNTNNASKESGEPSHAGNIGGKSVWWKWTANKPGVLTIKTEGSTFDTLLGVYTGSNVSQLTQIAADDDSGTSLSSFVTFPVTVGTTYYIAVDGYNGDSGGLKLQIQLLRSHNDFNGDGKSDILWRHAVTGSNHLYLMNGRIISSNIGINTEPDLHWEIAGTGDFNGDGNSDILWRHAITGTNWLYLMNGSFIISSIPVNTESDLNWKVAGVGDFNGDGNADILWRHNLTGDNWIYLMNGGTIINRSRLDWVSDLNWKVAGTGDFNGDGKDDILWHNQLNGRIWMYLMDGIAINTSSHVAFTGLDWVIYGTGDFNGDGNDDILWRNNLNGRVWIYLMNGTSISTSNHLAFSDLSWQIQTTGDYNGDGKTDILWRNTQSGLNWMYLLNGLNIIDNNGVDTVPDLNWKIIK